MEHDPQQDAPLATGSLAGSEEQLVRRAGAPGGSNKRALKVAGLTTLACLLLASQVFMAYTLFGQTKQIQKLQKNSEAMKLRLRAIPPVGKAPMKMNLPSLPLLMKLAEDTPHPADTVATAQPGLIQTKCQMAANKRLLGEYKPQCDEQGRYMPMQCWSATGFCWCVDESGVIIEGTEMRGHPDCQRMRLYGARRRTMMAPHLTKTISVDN